MRWVKLYNVMCYKMDSMRRYDTRLEQQEGSNFENHMETFGGKNSMSLHFSIVILWLIRYVGSSSLVIYQISGTILSAELHKSTRNWNDYR